MILRYLALALSLLVGTVAHAQSGPQAQSTFHPHLAAIVHGYPVQHHYALTAKRPVVHAQVPPSTWDEWNQHGPELALRQTRACLGERWLDAETCIYVAHSACEATLQSSLVGRDQAEGVCYEAAADAWKDLLAEHDQAARRAIAAREGLANKAAALAEYDKSQRAWSDWIAVNASMTYDALAEGTLRYSYPIATRLEQTAHRAIELEALASTLTI